MKFTVTTTIDSEDMSDALLGWDHDTALDFIAEVDLAIAETGFTESLIKRLAKSLQGDLSRDDYLALIEELRSL